MLTYHPPTILAATPVGPGQTEMEIGYGWRAGRSVMGVTKLSEETLLRLGGELRPINQLSLSVFGLSPVNAPEKLGVNVQGKLRY